MTDPAELLSAYIDDELSDAERAEVDEWLAGDPARRVELDGLAAVRDQVRALPWLEMPAGLTAGASPLFGRGVSRRHRMSPRRANVFAGVTAAMAVVVLAGALVLGGGRPAEASAVPVDEAVEVHDGGPWTGTEADGYDVTAPPSVDGYRVVAIAHLDDGLTGMRYSDGTRSFSVFERAGRVKWESLEGGQTFLIQDDPAWFGVRHGYDVMVLERGDRVYVVIGDDRSSAEKVSREMPGGGAASLWTRVTRRCHDTLRVFGGG